jgi:hypothetical protein
MFNEHFPAILILVFFVLYIELRVRYFGPEKVAHKILGLLKKEGPKTRDEIAKSVDSHWETLALALESLESRDNLYIVRKWRGPWGEDGFKQDPWVYDITPIGLRVLDGPKT